MFIMLSNRTEHSLCGFVLLSKHFCFLLQVVANMWMSAVLKGKL